MKTLNKIISGLVIGGTILSTGAVAMADTKTPVGANNKLHGRLPIADKVARGGEGRFGKNLIKNNMDSSLKSLVSAGILSQDEADKILALSESLAQARQAEMDKIKAMTADERKAYFASMKEKTPQMKGDIFSQAVSSGIITQEKADATKAKLQEIHYAERKAKLTERLGGLVKEGTITQNQSDKVLAYIDALKINRPAPGSAPEKPWGPAAPSTAKKNPLSALVDDGTLTQEQLDAIAKVLPMGGGHRRGGPGVRGMKR